MAFGVGTFGTIPFGGQLGSGAGPSAQGLIVRIGPADETDKLVVDGYRLSEQLNGRDSCELALITNDAAFVPQLGQSVVLNRGGVRRFAGTIETVRSEFLSEARNDWRRIAVTAVDHNEIADRHLVAEVYENLSLGAICRDIVAKYLAADGIEAGGVQEGPTLARIVLPRIYASEAFDELSKLTGFYWNIDDFKVLHVFERTTSLAPFAITNGVGAVFRKIRVSRSRGQYRNVQFIDGGHGLTDPQMDYFIGNGTLRTFSLRYPVQEMVSIRRANNPQTVGVQGIETNKQWYWRFDSSEVSQHPNDPPMNGATDRLEVTYIGRFPILSRLANPAEVAARQAIEGGSGVYEHLIREDALDGVDVVHAKAQGELKRYGTLDDEVEFELDQEGLAVGQQLTLTVPEVDPALTNLTMLIDRVEREGFGLGRERATVHCTSGEVQGGEKAFWQALFRSGKRLSLREDEILQEFAGVEDAMGLSDSIAAPTIVTPAAGEWGESEWGESLWGD